MFCIITVDFVLALKKLFAILKSKYTYDSSMFKQLLELKDCTSNQPCEFSTRTEMLIIKLWRIFEELQFSRSVMSDSL